MPGFVRVDEIIATKDKPTFSFEFFPPKSEDGERNLRATLEHLRAFEPDFVSVTYGAGGSTRERTVELTKWIKEGLGIESMAHLSCVGTTREELVGILDGIRAAGIENVLALRGDPPRGQSRVDAAPRRASLLDRTRRTHLRALSVQRRRGVLPGGPPRGPRPGP